MSFNSSSIFDIHLVSPCLDSKTSSFIIYAVGATKILLMVPLCIFVIYLGYQQWRRTRSFDSASHSDVFTYHLAVMEMFWVVGFVSYICGNYSEHVASAKVGICLSTVTFYGELFFHMLSCVERYLAVVHPITYLGLRNSRSVWVRNIIIGCVWLLCSMMASIYGIVPYHSINIVVFSLLIVCIIVIIFCSMCVLCVLIHPAAGGGGGEKERVNYSKQRAFHAIAAISGVLWVWFIAVLVSYSLTQSSLLDKNVACIVSAAVNWFNLPTSLVSPLLYLYKAGKLTCCCWRTE